MSAPDKALDNSSEKIPSLDVDSSIYNLYEKREKIFTRSIEGFFQNVRLFTRLAFVVGLFPHTLVDA